MIMQNDREFMHTAMDRVHKRDEGIKNQPRRADFLYVFHCAYLLPPRRHEAEHGGYQQDAHRQRTGDARCLQALAQGFDHFAL